MSRIPVPTNHSIPAPQSNTMAFPDRALSPTPKHQSTVSLSTLSGSNMDTRKKQGKRDEVRSLLVLSIPCTRSNPPNRQFAKRSKVNWPESAPFPQQDTAVLAVKVKKQEKQLE